MQNKADSWQYKLWVNCAGTTWLSQELFPRIPFLMFPRLEVAKSWISMRLRKQKWSNSHSSLTSLFCRQIWWQTDAEMPHGFQVVYTPLLCIQFFFLIDGSYDQLQLQIHSRCSTMNPQISEPHRDLPMNLPFLVTLRQMDVVGFWDLLVSDSSNFPSRILLPQLSHNCLRSNSYNSIFP